MSPAVYSRNFNFRKFSRLNKAFFLQEQLPKICFPSPLQTEKKGLMNGEMSHSTISSAICLANAWPYKTTTAANYRQSAVASILKTRHKSSTGAYPLQIILRTYFIKGRKAASVEFFSDMKCLRRM